MNKADIAFAKASEQGVLLRVSTSDVSADELEKNIRSLWRRGNIVRMSSELFASWKDSRNSDTLKGASIRQCAEDGPLIYLVPGQVGGSLLMVAPDGSTAA